MLPSAGYKTYIAYKQNVPWFQAWQTCLLYGGHLASIESAAENGRVEAAIRAVGSLTGDWFIGGTDIGIEGRFAWIGLHREITASSYKNYAPGEPNNSGGAEDCLSMGSQAGSKWNDLPCTTNVQGFVCAFVK
uniref:C-type lectin domain-containing protein n=1 Tax=Anopheles dirus TaxID=7168 RepID=A0A182N2M7_9DIPT